LRIEVEFAPWNIRPTAPGLPWPTSTVRLRTEFSPTMLLNTVSGCCIASTILGFVTSPNPAAASARRIVVVARLSP
jgi:hypothetical protein